MATVSMAMGPAATIDPELLKAAIKRKTDRVIDQNVPPIVKAAVSASFKGGAAVSALGSKAAVNYILPGAESVTGSVIDAGTQASAQSSMRKLEPKIDACALKTADVTKQAMHKITDKSVDAASSSWV